MVQRNAFGCIREGDIQPLLLRGLVPKGKKKGVLIGSVSNNPEYPPK
jgi:hypothetical protein